ncbi:hypothetical protein FA13DRAFT_1791415 [Coprinellus micaceus]|uniref:GH16 domain-containing protein n=1 Tax=Coprinellus micaceus TaxID=71717 RepID=A0A4Y7TBU8_COPMI|nr:hypothetical protein FA13DRAFT_1791415 [Coprinellus micaceus]
MYFPNSPTPEPFFRNSLDERPQSTYPRNSLMHDLDHWTRHRFFRERPSNPVVELPAIWRPQLGACCPTKRPAPEYPKRSQSAIKAGLHWRTSFIGPLNSKIVKLAYMLTNVSLVCIRSISGVAAGSYVLSDSIVGTGFYDFFDWHTQPDPAPGRIEYVDQQTAKSLNLTYADGNTFVLRPKASSMLDPAGLDRKSVKILSRRPIPTMLLSSTSDTCLWAVGITWPAVWETDESNWPNEGEVDILEGANPETQNTHQQRHGCGVKLSPASYGPAFNQIGGGWYVVEGTTESIKVWFWSRDNTRTPLDVKNGSSTLNTDNYGIPAASFPNT